jgi:acetolactate synthase-1/2/3 large subunit
MKKIRVSDYIASSLIDQGIDLVFLVNGGMMMHLVDTLGHPGGLKYICNHHEQASAMAADGYARRRSSIAVCYATSGPGATNLLTGLVGAWQDSTPLLFLTGQSKSNQTIHASGIKGLRQFGTFEVDIVPIVSSVTKYAQLIMDPNTIRYHLEKAIYLATNGRPGPVLLDLPLDVQGALIDPEEQIRFCSDNDDEDIQPHAKEEDINKILSLIGNSSRPLILAGYGVRCARAVDLFQLLVERLKIPVVTTQLGKDILHYGHPLFVGHPGPKGDRAGNFAVQTADLILCIGCSLHAQTTGWESDLFAPDSIKVQIDPDLAILAREQINVNYKIHACCKEVIEKMLLQSLPAHTVSSKQWISHCASWKERYTVSAEPHIRTGNGFNYYEFGEALSSVLTSESASSDISVIADAGSSFYVMGQALRLKAGQRFISSGSMGAMGYAVPASTGAALGGGQAICVTGDGSLMTNIHELATIKHSGLDVKLFIINNHGYVSMRNTQRTFCSGHYVGADIDSGVFIPPIESIAGSYGIPFVRCRRGDNIEAMIISVLAFEGPVICEVIAMKDQSIIPAVQSVRLPDGSMQSSEIHNMAPFLDESLLAQELHMALGETN